MIPHLYRFRPADAVLDKYEELANQQIYFSPPEELNDPMEGYKDVFWLGDRIVWRNLLRHYLLCLLQTASLCLVTGPKFDRSDLNTIIFSAFDNLPHAPVRAIYQRACDALFADANIPKLVAALASRTTSLRRDELSHILRAIHPFALSVLFKELKRDGVDGIFRNLDAVQAQAATMNETVVRVAAMTPPQQEVAEALFLASELMAAQMALIQDYNTVPPAEAKAVIFLTRDFPTSYVRALDELIHPPFFTACFVENPTDASMWAAYGNAHTGVCLKFKTTPDGEGRPALNLNGITGWRGEKMEPIYSFVPRAFHKMNYSESYPEIDFFNSIGRLPIPVLNRVWYNGDDGERSACRGARFCDTDAWRQKYWGSLQSGATCKTSEWAHEQEYRLLLWSSLHDYNHKASRKLRYNFSDLSGIIFGAKTASEDKLKIMRIVEEKCKAEKRDDFEFHQVQYSRKDRSFRVAQLSPNNA
jgi:Protein of unknown function (DUF2971)